MYCREAVRGRGGGKKKISKVSHAEMEENILFNGDLHHVSSGTPVGLGYDGVSATFTSRHRPRLEATWIESRSADNYRRRRVGRQRDQPRIAAHARYPTSAPPHSQSRSHNASGEATLATKDAFSAAVFPKPTTRDVSRDTRVATRDFSARPGRLFEQCLFLRGY